MSWFNFGEQVGGALGAQKAQRKPLNGDFIWLISEASMPLNWARY